MSAIYSGGGLMMSERSPVLITSEDALAFLRDVGMSREDLPKRTDLRQHILLAVEILEDAAKPKPKLFP